MFGNSLQNLCAMPIQPIIVVRSEHGVRRKEREPLPVKLSDRGCDRGRGVGRQPAG